MELFKTAKKTATVNGYETLHLDDKVLLDLHILEDSKLAELMLFDDEWALLTDAIKRDYQPYEDNLIVFIRINDFDFAEVKAFMRRTYVFNKKTGNLLYRVCEMTAAKVSVIRHKTKAYNDVGTVEHVIVGDVFVNRNRQDVEI